MNFTHPPLPSLSLQLPRVKVVRLCRLCPQHDRDTTQSCKSGFLAPVMEVYPPKKKKTTSGMRRKLVTIRGWRWKHGNSCRNPKNPLNLHFVRIASYSGVCIDPRYGFVAVIQSAGLCEPFIFTQILFNIAKKQLAGFIHQIFPKRSFSGEKIAWKPPFSNNKLCAIHFSEQIFKRTTIKTFEMASPVVFLWWGYYLITCHGW